ncbi:tyrosine-type recombinase/integrase [Ancylobacter mangrovi]|uniref:tyrosine-type recombinase/integrase n=1 Tax=Ancylobacter mangrovi TaxID=2972472 RepID=UPI0021639765|nr:site-specific integrase [Ancylobacter mangrovi]MCS0501560.1 site-specific integrase [Ancylobacter mangrovi]
MIAIYLRDRGELQANQKAVAERCRRLLMWWGDKSLADVSSGTCRAYVEDRRKAGGARRDLEDLRAAIQYHAREGLHRGEVRVTLPDKGPARERWLTRDEAAALLWACWHAREKQRRSHKRLPGESLPTRKYTMRHLARFILIGLYTGTRAGAIASASWAAASGRSYVDVERGVFYRLPQGAKATKKRQPPVPIPDRLLAHIRRWKETGVSREYLVEYHGAPVKSVKVAFARAVDLAGLDGKITPHTLRHTAATWLMQAGVPIWEAAGFLGMSPEMLERTYGHHHPDHMKGAARALSIGANKTPMKRVNQKRTSTPGAA